MLTVLNQSWALLLGMFLLMLGNGLQGTLLGVRGSLEGIDAATLGIVMSAYFVGFLGGSWLAPSMLRRVGHVRVFAALGSLVSAAFILYAAVVHPAAWFVFRLLVGFCFSGIYVVAESWLNNQATNETRGQTLSLYLIVQMGGIVLGQVLLNAADPGGYTLFVMISVLVSISFAPILLSTSPTPHHATQRPMPLRKLLETSPLASVGMFLLGGIFAALFAMSSVYATEAGLSIAQTSAFVTAIFLGGLVCQYPIGWLSDRIDRRRLIVGTMLVGAAACAAALTAADTARALVACAFVIGGTANPLYGLLIAYANDHLELEDMAGASSGLLFVNGVGAMTGPVIVGQLMGAFGPGAFFGFVAALMSAVAAYALWRMTRRAAVPASEVLPYVAVSSRTSVYGLGVAAEIAEEERLEQLELGEDGATAEAIEDEAGATGTGAGR